ncbi:MAG: cation diffusion facilitator family transporter [Rhodobacteraceae bacterium]|nr:cation diffusion facilitator family transporter [Paracoccaceae bacterium]
MASRTHGSCDHGFGSAHAPDGDNSRRILWALMLIGGFLIVEVIGGLLSGSLALLADAAHMLIDAIALSLAWLAIRLCHRPANPAHSYGYHRLPVLAAFANGISLVFIVCWIFVEAAFRFFDPAPVLAGPMLAVAAIGLGVNVVAFGFLHGADRNNLNVRGALLHVLGDLLGSVAAIAAAIIIMTTGWTPVDLILSMVVGLVILKSAAGLIRDSAHVLLEGTPRHLEIGDVESDLVEAVPHVQDIHHVHLWMLSEDRSLLTLHARISEAGNSDFIISSIRNRVAERFGIKHVTVQVETERCTEDPVAACV